MSRTLTRKLAIIEPGMLLVGLDLALKRNVAIVIDQQARQVERIQFSHTRAGYDKWHERMAAVGEREGASGVLVGMEPTNYFWRLVAAELEQRDQPYRLVNPYTVRKYREGMQLDRAKDDDRDGFVIGELLRTGKYTDTQRQQGPYAELQQYALLYRQLQADLQKPRTRLHQAVGQLFPELGEVFKQLDGLTVTAMLRRHAAAAQIRALAEDDFLAGVCADYEGVRPSYKKLRQAYQLAQRSVGLLETAALQQTIAVYLTLIAQYQQQQEQVREALLDTFLSLEEAPYLLSLNLGLTTTALLLAEIGDPRNYRSGVQLVKLAGLQPSPNTSGQRQSTPTPLSRKGRGQMRKLLFFACMRLVQEDEAFASLHRHLQERAKNPLKPKQSLTVLSTRVLHILWALLRQRTFYDPARWQQERQP